MFLSAGFTSGETTWLPVNENYVTLNLEAQRVAERSTFKIFQALTALRTTAAAQSGALDVRAIDDVVLAYTRWFYNEFVFFFSNLIVM